MIYFELNCGSLESSADFHKFTKKKVFFFFINSRNILHFGEVHISSCLTYNVIFKL